MKQKCSALGIKLTPRFLVISIERQLLMFYENSELRKSYLVSTSSRPPSNVRDSLGTPRGLHTVADKIGAGTPPGIVFKNRTCTGRHFNEFTDEENAGNLITTRILWLRGLEPGGNAGGQVDTYERYIYIHGTNHEERLGLPASAGCVLMRNLDVIELFDQARVGDLVWIED
ncbi:MAG: L,D-transpeptidase [Opitutaceae bacterium]|nr:L,D-transpeptidase [Opitutaceae bacterium]